MHDGSIVRCSFLKENRSIVFSHLDKSENKLLEHQVVSGAGTFAVETMYRFLENPEYNLPSEMIEYILTLNKYLPLVKFGELFYPLRKLEVDKGDRRIGKLTYFYIPGFENTATLKLFMERPPNGRAIKIQHFLKEGEEVVNFFETFIDLEFGNIKAKSQRKTLAFFEEYKQDMLVPREFKYDFNLTLKRLRG